MYNKNMNERYTINNNRRSARHAAERRRAEQRGRSLTIGLCAALAVALCCLTFFLCRGGDGVAPAPDRSAQAFVRPSASPEQAAAPTDAPAEEASAPEDAASLSAQGGPSPAPSDAPAPSPTPLVSFDDPHSDARSQLSAAVPVLETEDELTQTTILISAAGDCTLGGNVGTSSGERFSRYADEYGLDYFFANVRGIFAADDLTVVNLEGPLTTQTSKRSGRQFNFRGSPEYVQILSGSSVEVCTLANNHALDFKEAGLNETAANVLNAGMGAAGYKNAWYEEKDGVRLCFLAFTEWDYSAEEIAARVREEKAASDIVIVSMHWGEELRAEPTNAQVQYGHAIIDAGGDLVLGHHPHVLGGLEQYKGKYIVYSLGNFCFGGNSNPDDKTTMIFQQTFAVNGAGEVTDGGINIIPCSISSAASTNNYQPTPLTGEAAAAVINRVASLSSVQNITWMDSYTGMR